MQQMKSDAVEARQALSSKKVAALTCGQMFDQGVLQVETHAMGLLGQDFGFFW
jgi:hypothetical protein